MCNLKIYPRRRLFIVWHLAKPTWFPQSHAIYKWIQKYPHYNRGKSAGHEVTGYNTKRFLKEMTFEKENPSRFWLAGLQTVEICQDTRSLPLVVSNPALDPRVVPNRVVYMRTKTISTVLCWNFRTISGIRKGVGIGLSYRPAAGYTDCRNRFRGIDSWAPSKFKNTNSVCRLIRKGRTSGFEWMWRLELTGGGGENIYIIQAIIKNIHWINVDSWSPKKTLNLSIFARKTYDLGDTVS